MALSIKKSRIGDLTEKRWFKYDDTTEVLISRIDNPQYTIADQRFQAFAQEKRRRLLREAGFDKPGQTPKFDAKLAEVGEDEQSVTDAQCHNLSLHVLHDVRTIGREDGMLEMDGELYEYGSDLGYQLLSMNVDFFVFVISKAGQIRDEAYAVAFDAEKKQSKPSGGKRSGKTKTSAQSKNTQPSASS